AAAAGGAARLPRRPPGRLRSGRRHAFRGGGGPAVPLADRLGLARGGGYRRGRAVGGGRRRGGPRVVRAAAARLTGIVCRPHAGKGENEAARPSPGRRRPGRRLTGPAPATTLAPSSRGN